MSIGTKFIYENYVVQKDALTGEPEGLSFTQIAEAARAMPRKQRRRELKEYTQLNEYPLKFGSGMGTGRPRVQSSAQSGYKGPLPTPSYNPPKPGEANKALARQFFKQPGKPGDYSLPGTQLGKDAAQSYSGVGSGLRGLDPSKLKIDGDPKTNEIIRSEISSQLSPYQTQTDSKGKVTQIGTTPRASTVAKGVSDTLASGTLNYDSIRNIRKNLQMAAKEANSNLSQEDLDKIGLTGNKELDSAIAFAGTRDAAQKGALDDDAMLAGEQKAILSGGQAGREAYYASLYSTITKDKDKDGNDRTRIDTSKYTDPDFGPMSDIARQRMERFGSGRQSAKEIKGKELEYVTGVSKGQLDRLRSAGVPDDAIARYQRDMYNEIGKPMLAGIAKATGEQRKKTAQTAADMRTLRRAGSDFVAYGGR